MKAYGITFFLLLFTVTINSCEKKVKETRTQNESLSSVNSNEDSSDSTSVTQAKNFDHKYDDISSFIAGLKPAAEKNVNYYDSTKAWNSFSNSFDSIWNTLIDQRLSKMKQWKSTELASVDENIHSLFYPFSGPDYLNADIFFGKADTFRMIGLEPIGELPDLSKMKPSGVRTYLNSVNTSLNDLFKKSYFITKNMLNDLGKNKVNGTLPVICLFIKRTGHTIRNIEYIGVDSSGNIIPRNDTIPFKGTKGVKVEFSIKGKNKVKTLYYFKTDLSDPGLKSNKGFTAYLNKMDTVVTYLKAASHLLHYGSFSTVRNIALDKSSAILQDDSGISYKFFDKNKWNVKLYGNYRKAVKDFKGVDQPDLKKAYESDSTIQTLPFSLGYHWGSDEINLQLATRKY